MNNDDAFPETSHARPATLRAALEERYNGETLRRLARLVGAAGPTRKADLAIAIAGAVLGRDVSSRRTVDLFTRLTDIEKAAVAEALYDENGTFDGARFRAKYGSVPLWSSPTGTREITTLVGLFLLPGKFDREPDEPFIPADLATRLRRFVPEPRKEVLGCLDAPVAVNRDLPLTVVDTEQAATQEVFAVLRLLDMGKIQVSAQTHRPSVKGMAAMRELLVGGDFYPSGEKKHAWAQEIGPIRAFAWPLIVQAAGLASIAGSKLVLTAAGRRALLQPAAETLRHAWKKWVGTSIFDEFSRVDAIKGQSDRKRLTAAAGRREVIADALARCPVGAWISIAELSRNMQATGNTFEVVHDPWTLYIGEMQYGSLGYDGSHSWGILQERYITALLFEYAATLGLVDVAYTAPEGARGDFRSMWGTDELAFLSRYDGLSCLRLNALGAFILGAADCHDPATPSTAGGVIVLPNLDVRATGDRFSPGDEAFLATFCARRGEGYALDQATALAAIGNGHHVSELTHFLQEACGDVLPDTARVFLEDLERRATMLSVTAHALVIECAEPALASHLGRGTNTGHLCTLTESGTIIVPAESEAAFSRAMQALGYPLLSRAKGEDRRLKRGPNQRRSTK
jgi:hypothetical protein